MCTVCRYKASHLCHKHDKGGLAEQSRLTCHVWTGDNHNLLTFAVQVNIVGHEMFAYRELLFYHGVTTLTDVDHIGFVDNRSHIMVFLSHLGCRQQAVEIGHHLCIGLQLWDDILQGCDQFGKEPLFE